MTDYAKYRSEGVAFINKEKKIDKHPDLRGHITINRAQVERLIEMAQAGQEPRLQIGIWKRIAKSDGQFFLYMSAEAYMRESKAEAKGGWYQPAAQQAPHAAAPKSPDFLRDEDAPTGMAGQWEFDPNDKIPF